MRKDTITFDESKREIDPENGRMRIRDCIITRESVDPYYGYEIPNFADLGLDPDEIYYVYRPAEEIELALPSFEGVDLFLGHHEYASDMPQKEHHAGAIMNDLYMNGGDMLGTVSVSDAEGINGIESGNRVDLSSAYSYIPILESGEWNGIPYQVRMTNIHGNHVALVEEGRVKGAMVADEKPKRKRIMSILEDFVRLLKEGDIKEDESELEKREKVAEEEFGLESPEEQEDYANLDLDLDKFQAELVKLIEGASESEDSKSSLIKDVGELLKSTGWESTTDEDDDDIEEDEDVEERRDKALAGDRKPKMKRRKVSAMDAATIKASMRNEMRSIHEAVRDVRPIVGDVDPFAAGINSASDVYRLALDSSGKFRAKDYPATAWRGMVHALRAQAENDLTQDWNLDLVKGSGLPERLQKTKHGEY